MYILRLACLLGVVLTLFFFPTATPRTEAQSGCKDPYEPNDGYRHREIQPGEMSATLCPQGDIDVYKLRVRTGNQAVIRLDSLPADFDLAIFDGQGNQLATSENGGTDPEEITWRAKSDDNLLIGIWGYNGASSSQSYRLPIRLMTQNSNAHQIRFNIKGSTFRQLEIVGQDQYGQVVSWRTGDGKRELFYAETKDWWWQGTIILTFEDTNRGWRRCVIDYLKEPTSDSWVPVMYTENQGCSGDAGSGQSGRVFFEQLDKVLNNEEDSLKLLGAIDGVSDRWQCTKALVDGFRNTPARGVIKIGKECAEIALEAARAILQKYDKGLEVQACPLKNRGDANCDGRISGVDYSIWLNSQCHPNPGKACADLRADFDADGDIDDNDYKIWLANS